MRSFVRAALMLACGLVAAPGAASAEVSNDVVKIGVLTDMTSVLSSALGTGSVDGARMAIEDFGGTVLGKKIELVFADHQNKADIGSTIARRWYDDEKVDLIVDIGSSAVGLAVQALTREKNRIVIFVGAASADLTGKACSPNGIHWNHDTHMFSNAVPRAMVKEGGDTWFLIVSDYAFGHSMEREATRVIEAAGGKVLGSVRHPINTPDFSSYLLQAQASGAKVVALLNAVGDTQNAIKQAREYRITENQRIAALVFLLADAHGLGLEVAQGTTFSTVFYWDLNAETRAFAERFMERNGVMPSEAHAGNYEAVMHYLKAVQATGTDDAQAVMKTMHETPVNGLYTEDARIAANGRLMRNAYLAQIKSPADSKGPWDYYEIIRTIPPEEAFHSVADSGCPFVQ